MMPLPTVFAPSVERNAPARLSTAAMASALRGVSARVDTAVAIALAEAWKPLGESKNRAMRTIPTSAAVSTRSGLLDRDGLHAVRDLLERVGRKLQLVDHVFELEYRQRVVVAVEQAGNKPAIDLVGLVLQPVDLDPVLRQVFPGLQPRHRARRQL